MGTIEKDVPAQIAETVVKKPIVNKIRPRVEFFGAWIDPLTMEESLRCVDEIIERKVPTQHVVVNVSKIVMMQKDRVLRQAVNSCGLINADGQGIVWGAKLLGVDIPERVTGIDLFVKIVERSPAKGYRIYLLGAKEEIVKRVADTFLIKYPGVQIAGYRNGYWKDEDEETVVQNIIDSKADCLFVAIPSPRKEIFLNKYVDRLNVPFVMGVGGSFDVVAGFVNRAPEWMQKAGLEWFYRLMAEPGRMWKRYLTSNAAYLAMLLKALFLGKGRYPNEI